MPFDVAGLFELMGGREAASRRLDTFFHNSDGSWALTGLGGLHAEMDNEPSVGAPWLYLFAGQPHKTQEVIRQVLDRLWSATPYGLPGNDDLGAMSSWYVWAAMGMYPGIPGRAELLLASPIFPHIVIQRSDGTTITVTTVQAGVDRPYVRGLRVDGRATTRPWLPESFVAEGGRLEYELSATREASWGAGPDELPPSFPPTPG